MFDSLNEKIRRSEGKPETAAARLLRYCVIRVSVSPPCWPGGLSMQVCFIWNRAVSSCERAA